MAELTLADLIAWEPRLRVPAANGNGTSDPTSYQAAGQIERWGDRELSWAVTARATAPMLPLLRGGELVLLPHRVIADSGVSLPLLLRELASHDATGVVLDEPFGQSSPLPVLSAETITPELENEINRLLTQRRGELYRSGTDLGRLLANLTAAGADLGQVLSATATALGVPAAVVDGRGAPLATSAPEALPTSGSNGVNGLASARGWRGDRLAIPLAGGETLWLGPVPRTRRALARVAGERIAIAAEAALVRAAQTRPRGPARAAALSSLLTGSAADASRVAATVGLPGDSSFRVVLAAPELDATAVQRTLAATGIVHDAGLVDGATAAIIELRGDAAGSRGTIEARREAAPRVATTPGSRRGWLAFSSPVSGAAALPGGAREARFVAALFLSGLISGPIARFDAIEDLGPYRLLYRLWGTDDLAAFTADALGELATRDRRGALRQTLLAYLEAGGSHVDAATRLGIHRNTLSYRLKQIAAMTGREPTNPETRLVLHLSLLAAGLPAAPEAK